MVEEQLDPNELPVYEVGSGLGIIGQNMPMPGGAPGRIQTGSLIEVKDRDYLEIDLELEILFDRREGRFVCHKLTGRRRPGGPEVTQARLRPARIAEYMSYVVPSLLAYKGEDGKWRQFESFDSLVPAEIRDQAASGGPTPEALKWAARLYRAAEMINAHPIKAITDQLGISTRTAHNWIAKARERGLLDIPSEPLADVEAEIRWASA